MPMVLGAGLDDVDGGELAVPNEARFIRLPKRAGCRLEQNYVHAYVG